MNDVKANRADITETKGLIESLNERVKYLSNVMNELAVALEPIRHSVNKFDENMKKKILFKVENI
jgi:16S rRNA G527 N7-methylase RsmG